MAAQLRQNISLLPVALTPASVIEPDAIGVMPPIARPSVVLPLPLSPTRPSVVAWPSAQADAVQHP